ncbi:hypothetical protein GBAR_LOCUS4921 [Geodia barretti]|uniref:Uncharacterized protein n=1 Tax=Geodia barretti TaxID=519541 RepID=A0AA35RA28_GEOBA|nr:hypothetical protein GBAR_LOCUS4921 [Geodia barretti]
MDVDETQPTTAAASDVVLKTKEKQGRRQDPLSRPPTLQELKKLGFFERVGVHYEKCGIGRRGDKGGGARRKTRALGANGAPSNAILKPILKAILNDWYERKVQPVTWGVLIVCLKNCDLNALASDIEEYVATLE